MKSLLIPLAMTVLGLGAGIGAGLVFGPEPDPAEIDAATDAAPADAERTDDSAGEIEFARLNNQFIVPVVKGEDVAAMVVLSLTLEVQDGGTESVFQNEPRLRDSFLRVLFDHANVGGFDGGFTQSGTMALLRGALREAAGDVLGPIVRDVLIVDIVRQEV